MKRKALGAVIAQGVQAATGLLLQILVARLLGIEEYGRFAILYGVVIVATAVVTGLIGDSLVVLDRSQRRVRAGLESMLVLTSVVLAVGAFTIAWSSGFSGFWEALVFAVALAAFAVEEIVRRMLIAHMSFLRTAATDVCGFLIALILILTIQLTGTLSLAAFLAGIAVGQLLASVIGWLLLPRDDRRLVSLVGADLGAVWRYGMWRGLQQVLRPSLFTVVRLIVLSASGLTSVGLLEAARTYTSPLILVIGGLSSFLFVRFADQHKAGAGGSVREADRVVLFLLLGTVVMSVIAVVLIPWVSPIAFGVEVDALAVIAWLAYGVSVAIVTPYGALGAVAGRQVGVFFIRLSDTLLAVLAVIGMLAFGAAPSALPFGLAVASMLGGLGLRWMVVATGREGDGDR
ncbi:lipopolysaccharide biosynthesis protein [Microbacterium sp.]|uniref:lipopolysaccharide biosynthesis protein n=1 Tax=Microbacterium sp. TaxID=51671 RepID=UPI0039E3D36B